MTFEDKIKSITDQLGISRAEIKEIYTEQELRRIREAGINGAKAGKALRKILDRLK